MNRMAGASRSRNSFTAQAEPVSGVYPPLHTLSNIFASARIRLAAASTCVAMVAVAPLQMAATHSSMADHGLDVGVTTHLAADDVGNMPDLAADPDLEPGG